ncbi:MAG: MBL fold metallo-hydrolase [Bacilli bacterium]
MQTGTPIVCELLRVGSCASMERFVYTDGRLKKIVFPAIVGLLHHPVRGPILIDTGYSDAFWQATHPFPERLYRYATPVTLPDEERLEVQLAKRNIQTEDVRTILFTHLHADHIAGVAQFTEATLWCSASELQVATAHTGIRSVRQGYVPSLLRFSQPCLHFDQQPVHHETLHGRPKWDVFGDGSVFAFSLPGHTAHQHGFYIPHACTPNGQDHALVFVADGCWTASELTAKRKVSAIGGGVIANRAAYDRTLAWLTDWRNHAAPDVWFVPSHCADTLEAYWTFGKERD